MVIKLLAVVWTVIILALCLADGHWFNTITPQIVHLDKLVHFAMFVGFGVLWTAIQRERNWYITIIAGVGLAVITELLQGILPINRDLDVIDGLADIAGAVVGCILVYRWF